MKNKKKMSKKKKYSTKKKKKIRYKRELNNGMVMLKIIPILL